MPNPIGAKTVYLDRKLAGIIDDDDFRALLTKLGEFMNEYCFWKKEGNTYLDYNSDLKSAIDKLMKWDKKNAVRR